MPALSKTLWGFFPTYRKSTGLQADAGSLPTGTCYKNGTATADTVTISKVATGLYKWTVSLASDQWADKDILEIVVAIADADAVAETVPVDRREVHWYSTDQTYDRVGAPAGASLAADVAAIESGMATEVLLTTVAGYLDTEIATVLERTNRLPDSPAAVGSAMALGTDALSAAAISTAALDKLCKIMGVTRSVNAAGTEIKVYNASGALIATMTKTGTDPVVWTSVFA